MEQSGSSYFVVLQSVPAERLDDVVTELMILFNVERAHAMQVASNAPIILMSRLNERQAQNVRSHVIRLEKLGAGIDLVTAPPPGVRSLTWPVLPHIATQPASMFLCPSCGERFIVQAYQAAPPAPSAPPSAPRKETQPAEAQGAEPEEEQIELLEAEAVEEAADVEAEPPAEQAQGEVAEAELLEEEVEEEEFTDVPQPAEAEAPAEGEQPSAGPLYRVSLRQRVKSSQRRKAAALIAKYQGISPRDASGLLRKALVRVLPRATKEQAAACQRDFKAIGIKVHVMRLQAK